MTPPTDEQLWLAAQALVKQHGDDFLDSLLKKKESNPAVLHALTRKRLSEEHRPEVCELMRTLPRLAQEDDGTDEWGEQAVQFFGGLRTILAARYELEKQQAFSKVAFQGVQALDGYVDGLEQHLAMEQGREAKFTRLALTDPANIEKSFRTHVASEKVQWQNSLIYQSHISPIPYWSQLLVAGADLLHAGAFEELLSPEDIRLQVLQSSRNWVVGMHDDKTLFRHALVAVVGELLEDPQERVQLESLLQRIGSKAVLPAPTPAEERDAKILETQARVGTVLAAASDQRDEMLEAPPSPSDAILWKAVTNPDMYRTLKPSTWLMLARRFPPGQEEALDDQLGPEVFNRIRALLLSKVNPAIAFPPPPEPTQAPVRKGLRP